MAISFKSLKEIVGERIFLEEKFGTVKDADFEVVFIEFDGEPKTTEIEIGDFSERAIYESDLS